MDMAAHRIGVISDTHGLMRSEALAALRGCELLLHAGDVGGEHVLKALGELAPVISVRGNNDTESWAQSLPETADVEIVGMRIHLLHDIAQLSMPPAKAGVRVVVCGHSHRPRIEERDGMLYFNPGSAGPRRFKLPVAVGFLELRPGIVLGHIIDVLQGGELARSK
jgi:putative phosphoesterase